MTATEALQAIFSHHGFGVIGSTAPFRVGEVIKGVLFNDSWDYQPLAVLEIITKEDAYRLAHEAGVENSPRMPVWTHYCKVTTD